MNLKLMRKFRKQFDYLLDNPSHTVSVKTDRGWFSHWDITMFGHDTDGHAQFELDRVIAIVRSDEYLESRKALVDDGKIEYSTDPNEWVETSSPSFQLPPSSYRKCFSWKHNASHANPVICGRGDGIVLVTGYDQSSETYEIDFNNHESNVTLYPITMNNLQPFQKVGYCKTFDLIRYLKGAHPDTTIESIISHIKDLDK